MDGTPTTQRRIRVTIHRQQTITVAGIGITLVTSGHKTAVLLVSPPSGSPTTNVEREPALHSRGDRPGPR